MSGKIAEPGDGPVSIMENVDHLPLAGFFFFPPLVKREKIPPPPYMYDVDQSW